MSRIQSRNSAQRKGSGPAVIVLGEALIDFVSGESGLTLEDASMFEKAAGGAPANVAVGLSRLGVEAGIIGRVGDEAFGHFLADTLSRERVDISQLRFDSTARTALAFVSLMANGERDFMFYRHPSADMLLQPEDIDPDYIAMGEIFHFGSISLISDPSRAATLKALDCALNAELIVSFDPNLRQTLWLDETAAREGIMLGWQHAKIVKISDSEAHFLTGKPDPEQAIEMLWESKLALLVITLGSRGCLYRTSSNSGYIPGFRVGSIDTTGAGDGFVAGLLMKLLEKKLKLSTENVAEILQFANAVGALTTKKKGAIPALPIKEQVDAFLKEKQDGNG